METYISKSIHCTRRGSRIKSGMTATNESGLTLVELLISLALASIIFLILAQLLSSSLRQEQRMLRLYQLNSAANRVFNTVNEEVRWADRINVAPQATSDYLVLEDLDSAGVVVETRKIALKIRPGGVPGDPEFSLFYDDGSGAGEVDLLPSNIEVDEVEFKNDQNANDLVNGVEFRPLIITSLALKSTSDDKVVVERQTAVANLKTEIELPGNGGPGVGTPFPTLEIVPGGPGNPGGNQSQPDCCSDD